MNPLATMKAIRRMVKTLRFIPGPVLLVRPLTIAAIVVPNQKKGDFASARMVREGPLIGTCAPTVFVCTHCFTAHSALHIQIKVRVRRAKPDLGQSRTFPPPPQGGLRQAGLPRAFRH